MRASVSHKHGVPFPSAWPLLMGVSLMSLLMSFVLAFEAHE